MSMAGVEGIKSVTGRPVPNAADIRLIMSDVDGTLLNTEHTLHSRTRDALLHVRKTHPDLPIVIATGKQRLSTAWIRETLNLPQNFPASHCNGALVYGDPAKGEEGLEIDEGSGMAIWQETCMSPDDVSRVVEVLDGMDPKISTFLFMRDEMGVIFKEPPGPVSWFDKARSFDITPIYDVSGDVKARDEYLAKVYRGEVKILKITLAMSEDTIPSVSKTLEDAFKGSPPFRMTRAVSFVLELIPPNVNKARALRTISERLRIDVSQIIAFGDGENDVEMLKTAGYGVAMAQGMESPKEVADFITVSNDEGGVGVFLDKIFRP